ncbi:sugar-binding protein [Bacteroidota bacterium]
MNIYKYIENINCKALKLLLNELGFTGYIATESFFGKLRMTTIAIVLILFSETPLLSQSGMRFEELSKRIEPYFAEVLIEDVKAQLPQGSDYKIWGWDVGDFSGDGYNDLAISVKISGEKKKVNHVYLFVDMDGVLTNVAQFPFDYVEMPLEIGIVIRYNTCHITKKREKFNWVIRGFRFDNGALVLNDLFETEKIGKYTHEKTTDYQTLKNTENYIITNNNDIVFSTNYLTIPSFYRSRLIYKGYQDKTKSNYIDYVHKGAYYWKGDKDCSFYVSSAYNEKFLYFTIYVNDDTIVDQKCDTCAADFVEVWFDTSPQAKNGERFVERKGKQLKFRKHPERGIFSFKIYPGDFRTKKAFIKDISTTDDLYDFQREEINKIKTVSSLRDGAYVLKFKIPFLVFAYDGPPIDNEELTEFGCSVVVHDIDNEYRPEEETLIATSVFDKTDPSTYGSIMLIPTNKWYGNAINVYKDDIIKALNEYGL